MNAQQLAQLLLSILPRVEIPMTTENVNAASTLYSVLGQMVRGELILISTSGDSDRAK